MFPPEGNFDIDAGDGGGGGGGGAKSKHPKNIHNIFFEKCISNYI